MTKEFHVTALEMGTLRELVETAGRSPAGCFVEVGVWRGGSAALLSDVAQAQGRKLYLYDTFEGMPYADPGDHHKVGDFSDTSYEEVCKKIPYATIVKGIFPGSAIPMEPIAFAHIDCDQYRSVRESSLYLIPLMVQGGIMWFDDYPTVASAKRAVDEVFGRRVLLHAGKGTVRVYGDMNGLASR